MNLYQVEITTEIEVVSILVNADDENEAISIAQTMVEQGNVDLGLASDILNIVAFPAC